MKWVPCDANAGRLSRPTPLPPAAARTSARTSQPEGRLLARHMLQRLSTFSTPHTRSTQHLSDARSAQVLVDGNFLNAVAQMKLGAARDVLVKYLGAECKLFTTRCVQHELRGMGAEFKVGEVNTVSRYRNAGELTKADACRCTERWVTWM